MCLVASYRAFALSATDSAVQAAELYLNSTSAVAADSVRYVEELGVLEEAEAEPSQDI